MIVGGSATVASGVVCYFASFVRSVSRVTCRDDTPSVPTLPVSPFDFVIARMSGEFKKNVGKISNALCFDGGCV